MGKSKLNLCWLGVIGKSISNSKSSFNTLAPWASLTTHRIAPVYCHNTLESLAK
jgi:hypothetical protein